MGSKIVFDLAAMQIMSLFTRITKAKLKDCIVEDGQIMFIVENGEMSKAIGKGGSNVKLLEKKLSKRVKIVQYSSDLCQFVCNLMYPAKVKDCVLTDGIVFLEAEDHPSRGLMIGRSASNLRRCEEIARRYFKLEEIKVK